MPAITKKGTKKNLFIINSNNLDSLSIDNAKPLEDKESSKESNKLNKEGNIFNIYSKSNNNNKGKGKSKGKEAEKRVAIYLVK